MFALQGTMAALVVAYYCWPAANVFLQRLAGWQQAGGILSAGLATALAGGLLSELSLIYFQDRGRWKRAHLENIAFKLPMFFVSGAVVCVFYRLQAGWWGSGVSWRVLLPKVLVDQFLFTPLWSTPYYSLLTRWQTLGFSGRKLWHELGTRFVVERMLPILVTNWMFWIPTITLLYSMPSNLQTTIYVFAMATWGLLLPAVIRQENAAPAARMPATPAPSTLLGEPAD